MKHKCIFCDYKTDYTTSLKKHILKKKKCSILINKYNIKSIEDYYDFIDNNDFKNIAENNIKIIDNKEDFNCMYCNKIFTRKDNLTRHYNICKAKNDEILSQIKQLKNEIKYLKDNKINSTTNNTINNYTINNILICNYGSEDRSILTKEFMLELLKSPYSAPTKMIEVLHFNKDYPENMNIRLSNKDNDKSQLIENGKWVTYEKELLINRMIDDNLYYLDMFYEEEIEKGSIDRIPHYEEFSKLYHEVLDKDLTNELIKRMNIRLNDLMEEHRLYLINTNSC